VTEAEIEAADPAEAAAIAELWVALARGQREHDSHLLAGANSTRVRDMVARYAARERLVVARSEDRTDAPAGTDVARSEDRTETPAGTGVVGFVMFRTRSDQYEVDCERGLVENLYVVPECRGQGIGSALLSAAERRLRERGVDAISLEAMAANEPARRFYRRHGYEPHRVEFEKGVDD
jgi:ribosomal protein S18 acetylase RimI-like enzyme